MKLKKVLAGVMAFAMTATMLPGGMFAVPDTVEAKTVTSSLPEPKYEMALDGNLDVTGSGAEGKTARLATRNNYAAYGGVASYAEGHDGTGQSLSTGNTEYGFVLEDAEVGATYTVSAWIKLNEAPTVFSPVLFVGNPGNADNWLGMAGKGVWYAQSDPWNPVIIPVEYKLQEWVNYTLTVNEDEAILYINGEEVGRNTAAGVLVDNSQKDFGFGVNAWNDDVPNAAYDNVKIYDIVLSAAQIKNLYDNSTAITLTAPSEVVRPGKTTELTADVISTRDDVTVEWSTESACVKVDNNGVVTGLSEGTATITATAVSGDDVLASDSLEIKVVPQGKLIADFTFDDEETGFEGAGAVAKHINSAAGNLSLVSVDGRGEVLNLAPVPEGYAGDNDGLIVTTTEGTGLLNGVEEFTVSYDSLSRGGWFNAWVFYADEKGDTDTADYLSIREESLTDIKPGRTSTDLSEEVLVNYPDGNSVWKHVDVVFANGRTEVYINGIQMASKESALNISRYIGTDTEVRIGDSNYGSESWNGMLDNFKIYNYALTAEEIASTPVSNIEVTADSSTMFAGNTLQLAATVTPDSATDKTVEWTSSDPEVAEVNENGLVTAKKAGNVTITATAQDKDGKSGSIDLTVKAALTYHEVKDPTCTEPGNIEYWTDAEGNYYSDAAGKTPTTVEAVGISATGHSYGEPEWNWVESEDGNTYASATATFACEKCDDTQQVTDNEITHVIENGQVTYSAEVTFGEQTYKTTTTEALVLTATEEKPATCTEAGTKAYWTDQFGNRYLDAEGKSPVTDDEELAVSATGHDYISSGIWTATEDGYSLDVTFTCKHGDDTATVSPEVTSSSDSGVTTYTAVAEYNGKQFTYTYEVKDSYTLTVVDGTIADTGITTNNYGYNDVVTVVADAEKDGQYFAGWYIGDTLVSNRTTYTFCIVEDKVLTAKYSAEETEEKAVVSLRMSDREDIGSGAQRVVATLEWSVPSDYTMMEAGILRSYTESSDEKLKLEEVDGSNVRQTDSGLWCKNGIYKLTVNMSPSTAKGPLNARGYLVYEDAEGNVHTAYTDIMVSQAAE